MSLTRKEYVEPDDKVTHQVISQRNQMQFFLITDGPLAPIISQDRPVATQDNCISNEEQHKAAIQFFGPPAKHAQVTAPVTTTGNFQQRTLFDT